MVDAVAAAAETAACLKGGLQARWPIGLGILERATFSPGELVDRSVLLRWRDIPALSDDSNWQHFLEVIGLSEPELLQAVSRPRIAERVDSLPSWVLEAIRLASGSALGTKGVPSVVKPWVVEARRKLAAKIRHLSSTSGSLRLSPSIALSLSEKLEDELLELAVRPVLLEAAIAEREGGECAGYEETLRRFSEPDGRLELFSIYPGLALAFAAARERWFAASQEFLARLVADWQALTYSFNCGRAAHVTDAWFADSDPHDNGRRVIIVRLSSGMQLVYKPRALAAFAIYQDLLHSLNEFGFAPKFLPQTVLDRGKWGWVTYVDAKSCRNVEELERFYCRLGGQLALLQLLGASDCHHENLVASGEHPQLVDLETLLSPVIRPRPECGADATAAEIVAESVLRTGLLPNPVLVRNSVVDLSGIGARSYQETPLEAFRVEADSVGRLQVIYDKWRLGRTYNRPRLRGRESDPAGFVVSIGRGFRDAFQILQSRRDDLIALVDKFRGKEVRVVLRPTASYVSILRDSYHPSALYDGVERDRVLARLWYQAQAQPWLKNVVGEEFRQLRRGDVPLFRAVADSQGIYSEPLMPLKLVGRCSGLDAALVRLGRMDGKNLRRQLALISRSIAALNNNLSLASSVQARPRLEKSLDLARLIGERLCEDAILIDGEATWLAPRAAADAPCRWLGEAPIRIVDSDLYSGLAGIILFLGHLFRVTGDLDFRHLAEAAARNLCHRIDEGEMARAGGVFAGLGGAAYTLAHLGATLCESSWLDRAVDLGARALTEVEKHSNLDLLSGLSGALLVQLALESLAPGAAVQTIRRIAERLRRELCANAPALPYHRGASHGHSGAVWALAAAVAYFEEPDLLSSEIVSYELQSTASGAWTDPGDTLHTDQATWCHGSPGVALCRAAAAQALGSERLRRGALAAIRASHTAPLPYDLGLCHGVAGVLEAELFNQVIGAHGGGRRIVTATTQLCAGAARKLEMFSNILDHGLMTGLSGLGMQLLRLADPRTPSVLLLQPPFR